MQNSLKKRRQLSASLFSLSLSPAGLNRIEKKKKSSLFSDLWGYCAAILEAYAPKMAFVCGWVLVRIPAADGQGRQALNAVRNQSDFSHRVLSCQLDLAWVLKISTLVHARPYKAKRHVL